MTESDNGKGEDKEPATNDDPGSGSKGVSIDQVFELLHAGKKCQSDGKHWDAADKFTQGRDILLSLAKDAPRETEEEQRIAKLYEQKSHEYLTQSRECLIEAMKQEKENDDKKTGNETPFFDTDDLTDELAENRLRTFCFLYSKPIALNSPVEETDKSLSDQQWSIEERLQELNASLPSGFKTSDERMDSINRGLNRLGLSLYTQKEPFQRFIDEIPKTEDEQIEDIMAQAQDEVAFEKTVGSKTEDSGKGNVDIDNDDDSDDDDESDDEPEDEEDAFLDDEVLAIKTIKRKVNKAQIELAELVSFLEEARAQKIAEDADEEVYDDDSSKDSITKPDAKSYLKSGKKKLKSAQKNLKKALQEWIDSLPES